MSVADLAIVAALVFVWGTLSARLERFDVTAPIVFVLGGLLLTHGPLAVLAFTPSNALIKELAEFTLALVLFSDASRVSLHELRADAGVVTSAAFSPDYGHIGAAMLRNEVALDREEVKVALSTGTVTAEVRQMPILRLG